MRGIYRRGEVYWICYAGLDGRIVRESSGSKKYRDAEALLIKRKQSIAEGKSPEVIQKIGNHTYGELVERYVQCMQGRHVQRIVRCTE
jgi:hypothetical protein